MTETAKDASQDGPAGDPGAPLLSSTPASRLVTVQGVNWQNVLDFTHLFRGFRLAINPAKLLLALFAIILIYSSGRLFDAAWGPQVYRGEINDFIGMKPDMYHKQHVNEAANRTDNLERLLREAATRDDSLTPDRIRELSQSPAGAFRALKIAYRHRFDQEVARFRDARVEEEKRIAERAADPTLRIYLEDKSPADQEQEKRAQASARLLDSTQYARTVAGRGIFDTLLEFEIVQFDRLVENTLAFVRVSPMQSSRMGGGGGGDSSDASVLSGGLLSKNPDRLWKSDTVAGCLANMTITAPRWLFTGTAPMHYRPANVDTWAGWTKMVVYRGSYLLSLLVLVLFWLVVIAFAGACISRLSALELAGIERAPLKDVFAFASARLTVFIKTPLAPFAILLVIALVGLTGLGLVGAIPVIGEILLGLMFVVLLGIAFVLMLLMLGILGGFNLLYPAVAVEGADAFDAMSRAFAYVYARPWRLALYTVVSLVYGVVTFLFVSFAVYLILQLTHVFAGLGTNFFGSTYGWNSGLMKLDTLWPEPQFMRLVSPINWYAMSWSEYTGALFLHFWVFLLITGIGAYVISYYFSSHTIMYLLMRRSVDGQNMREISMEISPVRTSHLEILPENIPPSA